MKTTPFSTLTGGHIMEVVRVLEKVKTIMYSDLSAENLVALRDEARHASMTLRIHSGLESLRIEVREEA